jgi:hypothetical protein
MNTASQIGKSNNEQGKKLEDDFALFLKNNLGYTKVDTRITVFSRKNPNGSNVDVMGKKNSNQGKRIMLLSKIMMYLSLPIMLIPAFLSTISVSYTQIFTLAAIGLSMIVLSAMILGLADYYSAEYAWVECKSSKDKTTFDQVDTMVSRFNAHMKNKHKRYNFKEKYFVSANGFIDNALGHAHSNGIICYICEGNEFKKI